MPAVKQVFSFAFVHFRLEKGFAAADREYLFAAFIKSDGKPGKITRTILSAFGDFVKKDDN